MEIIYAAAIIFTSVGISMWLFVIPAYFIKIATAIEKIAEKNG